HQLKCNFVTMHLPAMGASNLRLPSGLLSCLAAVARYLRLRERFISNGSRNRIAFQGWRASHRVQLSGRDIPQHKKIISLSLLVKAYPCGGNSLSRLTYF